MKMKILFIVSLMFATSHLRAQEKYIINWNYKGLAFKEFVSLTEKNLKVKFFYDDEWVKDLTLS
jgi:hypothetical protein